MRREQKLLLVFGALVLIPVGIIWFVTWPLLHAWKFPQVTAGQMSAPISRDLSADEVQKVNLWLQSHETAWGPSGEKTDLAPKVVLEMATAQGEPVIISIWKYKKQDDIVGIQLAKNGPYRMNAFPDAQLMALQPAGAQPGK